MLFILGGDGTHAGANAIHNEVMSTTISYHLLLIKVAFLYLLASIFSGSFINCYVTRSWS